MKYLKLVLIIFFSLYSLGFSSQQNPISRESKMGGFDFGLKLITDQELIGLYGKGCVDEDYAKHPDHYHRMYHFPEKNIYAAFDIGTDNLVVGLKLTTEPIVSKNCNAVRKLKNYETGKRINIGDLKEKVIKTYGEPSEEKVKKNDIVLYRYYVGREEGPYMEIEFSKDKVISIWVTVGD